MKTQVGAVEKTEISRQRLDRQSVTDDNKSIADEGKMMISRGILNTGSIQRSTPVAYRYYYYRQIPAESYKPQPEEDLSEEDIIDRKRNKSKLRTHHYNKLHGIAPVQTEDEEVVNSLSKQRTLFGMYGNASKVDVKKLWPSKEEIALQKEWENLAYPHSVQEMIEMARKEKQAEEDAIMKRQEDIQRKVAKLEMWKAELNARIHKRETEAMEAMAKKQALIEEVRQMLGFAVHPKDERFQEALKMKEKEEKKKGKEAKRLAKQQKMLERLRQDAQKNEESKTENKEKLAQKNEESKTENTEELKETLTQKD